MSLSVARGRATALVGANGAGKTTLLRTIAGAQAAASGSVRYAGSDRTAAPPHLPGHRHGARGTQAVRQPDRRREHPPRRGRGRLVRLYLLVRQTFGLDARAVGSDPVAAASAGVRVGRIRRPADLLAAGGAGAVGALIALQTLYVEPTSVFSIQYSVYMLFMVLIGGMGTIEGPVLGALVLFALQETLSSYGAWYLVIVGGLAVIATLAASRGLWGLVSDRFGWSLLPVGYQVRRPRG